MQEWFNNCKDELGVNITMYPTYCCNNVYPQCPQGTLYYEINIIKPMLRKEVCDSLLTIIYWTI